MAELSDNDIRTILVQNPPTNNQLRRFAAYVTNYPKPNPSYNEAKAVDLLMSAKAATLRTLYVEFLDREGENTR